MSAFLVPSRVAYVVADGHRAHGEPPTVFLMQVPDGAPVVLHGTAALIWLLASDGEEDVATAVADVVGLDRASVAPDVRRFLDDLVDRGLVEKTCSPTSGAGTRP